MNSYYLNSILGTATLVGLLITVYTGLYTSNMQLHTYFGVATVIFAIIHSIISIYDFFQYRRRTR